MRRREMLLALAACAAGELLVGPRPAAAQTPAHAEVGFSVDRFTPAAGPTPFLAAHDADVLGSWRYSLAVHGSLMARPIVLRNVVTGEPAIEPVGRRLGVELAVALGLGDRYQLGVSLPFVPFQQGDRLAGVGLDDTPLASAALGDVRLAGKARLVGRAGQGGQAIALLAEVALPTGDEDQLAGEEGAVLSWTLLASWRGTWLTAALDLGVRVRTREVILLSPARPHGNELTAAAAVALVVPGVPDHALAVVAEYALVEGDARSGRAIHGPSPGEARVGLRWNPRPDLAVAVAAGAGTTPDEVGSPAWRAIASVRYRSSNSPDAPSSAE